MPHVTNFSAGPAILPKEALEEAKRGLEDFKGSGLSVVEISHRSKEWEECMGETEAIIRELYNVPREYDVLFLQGGASTQFTLVPMNLLPQEGSASYLKTGNWAANAVKEAKLFGNVNVVATSEDKNFSYIPKEYLVPEDSAYLHFTTNNTVEGTQFKVEPMSNVPLVADMSSDVFSRPIDIHKYGLIYAGAQKNMGPAGMTMVIVKKDLLGKSGRKLPTMFDYAVHADKESMFNTPPVFAIYLSYLTLKWVKSLGGCAGIEKLNEEKARILYEEIDANPLFRGTTAPEDRSIMNATFVLNDVAQESAFEKLLDEHHISGLKGHRSVGGYRASMYNALPKAGVELLVETMQQFAIKNA